MLVNDAEHLHSARVSLTSKKALPVLLNLSCVEYVSYFRCVDALMKKHFIKAD
jgi:hypothetical protein